LFSDIFRSVSTRAEKFSTPVNADAQGIVNTSANEGAPFLNADYSVLYFTRCEKKPENKDGTTWCLIMKAERSGSRWENPEAVLSDPERNIGHSTLSADELTMIYSGANEGGSGQKDLWMVKRNSKKDPFGPPVNLGPVINTPGDEMFPYLRFDSLLYFASDGHGGSGGLDIFLSFRDSSGAWSAPQNPGPPINSNKDDFAIVFKKCCEEGFFSSNRDGGRGGDDIYHFEEIKLKVEVPVVDTVPVPIAAEPVVLPQILYELDKWDLQPQYQDSLLNFVVFLKDNPNLQIELRSHTDSRATDKYNDELSQKRAQTVVDFLISKGIEPGRLVAKGYGKRNPRKMETDFRSGDLFIPQNTILDESFISSLQKPEWIEIAHQLNRRTEFTIISTSYKK
jgi:peptidoglycan-associated lipoprotein